MKAIIIKAIIIIMVLVLLFMLFVFLRARSIERKNWPDGDDDY